MITQEIKKIWYGDGTLGTAKVTLRSYVVERAIKNGEDIKVVYVYGDRNKFMVLSPKQLSNPISKRVFKSKIGMEDYELWDYYWKPGE